MVGGSPTLGLFYFLVSFLNSTIFKLQCTEVGTNLPAQLKASVVSLLVWNEVTCLLFKYFLRSKPFQTLRSCKDLPEPVTWWTSVRAFNAYGGSCSQPKDEERRFWILHCPNLANIRICEECKIKTWHVYIACFSWHAYPACLSWHVYLACLPCHAYQKMLILLDTWMDRTCIKD